MRPTLILCLTTAALLGACASRSNTAGMDACTQRCAAADLPALERSSCELDCSRTASGTTPPTTTPPTTAPPQPEPPPQPVPPQQPPPQPVPPQQPPPQPLPPTSKPPTPQPTPVGSVTTNYTIPAGGGAPVPTGSSPQAAPADRQAIANCESACLRENSSSTDQATCKLNCNAVGTVYAPPPSYYTLGATTPSDTAARDAVIRSSNGVVPGSNQTRPPAGQPPAATPAKVAQCANEAQQCNSSCGLQLSPCSTSCDQGKMSSTDRATCKLTCESSVDLCRDDCRIKEGNCRSKP